MLGCASMTASRNLFFIEFLEQYKSRRSFTPIKPTLTLRTGLFVARSACFTYTIGSSLQGWRVVTVPVLISATTRYGAGGVIRPTTVHRTAICVACSNRLACTISATMHGRRSATSSGLYSATTSFGAGAEGRPTTI